MIEKVLKIQGRKTDKYFFKHDDKEYNYEIQEPIFDQITAALSQVKTDGRMDVIGAGKVIWELCCVNHDKEIEEKPRILMSVCVDLANKYALPIDLEIKKK